MVRLVVPMEMLGALDYDDAVEWLRCLHEVLRPGVQVVVTGPDRDRGPRRHPTSGLEHQPRPGWLASEQLVKGLLEASGWRWVEGLEGDGPGWFEVSATR